MRPRKPTRPISRPNLACLCTQVKSTHPRNKIHPTWACRASPSNKPRFANFPRSHPPELLRPGEADSSRRHSDDNPICRPVTLVPWAVNAAAYMKGSAADVVGQSPATEVPRLIDCSLPAWGAGSRSLPPAEPTTVQRIVAKLSVRLEPFPPGLLLVRGCRMHLPSVWFTRRAGSTGTVVFRFILLCLCLPVSRGRIGGTVVASPCQGNLSRGLPSRQPGRFPAASFADVPPERFR